MSKNPKRERILKMFKIGELENPITKESVQAALEIADMIQERLDDPTTMEHLYAKLSKELYDN